MFCHRKPQPAQSRMHFRSDIVGLKKLLARVGLDARIGPHCGLCSCPFRTFAHSTFVQVASKRFLVLVPFRIRQVQRVEYWAADVPQSLLNRMCTPRSRRFFCAQESFKPA